MTDSFVLSRCSIDALDLHWPLKSRFQIGPGLQDTHCPSAECPGALVKTMFLCALLTLSIYNPTAAPDTSLLVYSLPPKSFWNSTSRKAQEALCPQVYQHTSNLLILRQESTPTFPDFCILDKVQDKMQNRGRGLPQILPSPSVLPLSVRSLLPTQQAPGLVG